MNVREKNPSLDKLFECVLLLNSIEECYAFFDDICTINELHAMAQRLEVAKELCIGKTYLEISKTTGASTATISRVNRSLNYGADGYRDVFQKIGIKMEQRENE